MQGINCIKGEIHNVLTVLRLNSQSVGSLYSGMEMQEMEMEEQLLIRGLKELYEQICMQADLAHVDTLAYLTPFLTVITSKHTDIFTTAIALHSIHKFLVYGLIHADSPNVAAALTQIADSVTHCTFDVTDGEDAEVVSMKILEILLECLRCSAGEFLTDQAVLDMITECFHVRSQQHSSKLLRRYAENVLMQMVLVLFARISPESSNATDLYNARTTSPSPSPGSAMLRSVSNGTAVAPSPGYRRSISGSGSQTARLSVHSTIKDWNSNTEMSVQKFNANTASMNNPSSPNSASAASTSTASLSSYGIPALHRVFRFLTNLINPGDVRNTEQDRILGLRLIRTVLETSSTRIGIFPPLIQVIQDELCKYLLQNSQSKNLFVLSLTLRIVFDLFITVKQHLKVQLEVFFTSIHLRIGESASSTFQQKELVLESLVEFCKEVSLIVGLYRNYDCELGCTDLFQDLCKFLTNTAMAPWTQVPPPSTSGKNSSSITHPNQLNILALEGMVSVLNAICKRFCGGNQAHRTGPFAQLYAIQRIQEHGLTARGVGGDITPRLGGLSLTPALSQSNSFTSGLSGGGVGGDESDDESTLLILSPEEEAHLLNKRANKQKLALAADQFNREGLTLKCVKYLQSLKILPPSVQPANDEDEQQQLAPVASTTKGLTPNASSNALAANNSTATTPTATTSPPSNSSDTPTRTKIVRPVKSKHDPGIPPISIVQFFRNTPGLDKVKIGEYLGDADVYNIKVLDAFVDTFDFTQVPKTYMPTQSTDENTDPDSIVNTSDDTYASNDDDVSLDDALRSFLDGFKLPGESQQIARIIEKFSAAYYAHTKNTGPLKSADAAYVLCYSVIMLNTDAHNSQVTRKMTKEMYCRNLRGINDNEDLPKEYLEKLYDSIVHNEIKIKSDSVKDLVVGEQSANTDSWNRVVKRSKHGGGTDHSNASASFQISAPRIHGREMFLLIWQSCISMFIHYLENQCSTREGWLLPLQPMSTDGMSTDGTNSASNPPAANTSAAASSGVNQSLQNDHIKILPKIVQGFSLFCRICSVYNLNEILNSLLIALCKCLIGFFEELCIECNWDSKEIQISFARDIRISHLLQLLFSILHEYGEAHVLEGWSNCVHVLLWLRQMELLPKNWLDMEDFRDGTGKPLESLRYTSLNPHTPNPHRLKQELAAKKQDEKKGFLSWNFWSRSNNNNESSQHPHGHEQQPAPVYTPTESHWLDRSKEIITACQIPELFENSKYFRPNTLSHLVKSLILISSSGTKNLGSIVLSAYSSEIMHEESAVFCLERLSDVIEKNQSRLNVAPETPTSQAVTTPSATPGSATSSTLPSPAAASAAVASSPSASTSSNLHLWSTISQHFELSIVNVKNDEHCTFYIERLVVNLLRFSVRLVYSKETTTQLIRLLALLLQLSKSTFVTLAPRIIAGISLFLQTHGESISQVNEWEVIFNILLQFKHHSLCSHQAFQTFTYVVENHCTMETFVPLMNALTAYSTQSEDKDAWLPIAPEAVLAQLLRLHTKLTTLSIPAPVVAASPHIPIDALTPDYVKQLLPAASSRRAAEFERGRTDLWLASLQNFCTMIKNDDRPSIRKAALEALNNSLLAVGVSPPISPLGWKICFEKLLIPLLEGVQKYLPEPITPKNVPSIVKSDGKLTPGRPGPKVDDVVIPPYDLRLKAATLVFQTFLHHLDVLCLMHDFHIFWLKFVGSMERFMKQGTDQGRGALSLHFSESLKNVLLVMYSSGIFANVSEKTGQNLLSLTWSVIDSFRPELRLSLQEHMKPLTNIQPRKSPESRTSSTSNSTATSGRSTPTLLQQQQHQLQQQINPQQQSATSIPTAMPTPSQSPDAPYVTIDSARIDGSHSSGVPQQQPQPQPSVTLAAQSGASASPIANSVASSSPSTVSSVGPVPSVPVVPSSPLEIDFNNLAPLATPRTAALPSTSQPSNSTVAPLMVAPPNAFQHSALHHPTIQQTMHQQQQQLQSPPSQSPPQHQYQQSPPPHQSIPQQYQLNGTHTIPPSSHPNMHMPTPTHHLAFIPPMAHGHQQQHPQPQFVPSISPMPHLPPPSSNSNGFIAPPSHQTMTANPNFTLPAIPPPPFPSINGQLLHPIHAQQYQFRQATPPNTNPMMFPPNANGHFMIQPPPNTNKLPQLQQPMQQNGNGVTR